MVAKMCKSFVLPAMISKKRDRQILELLAVRGELSVEEACRKFSISPATARRAFARMAAGGLAEKTWGGLSRVM